MDSFTCLVLWCMPFPIHYFCSSPVDDVIVLGDVVCDGILEICSPLLLCGRSCSLFLCPFCVLPAFHWNFCLFLQCKHYHTCDMVSCTHIHQCLLYYVYLLGVPESAWVSWLLNGFMAVLNYSIFPQKILFTLPVKPFTYGITTGFLFTV